MKKTVTSLIMMTIIMTCSQIWARDAHWLYSIDEALATRAAKLKLDPAVRLYFGSQAHPAIEKPIGEWKVARKAGGVGRSDKAACQRTFINALIEMQKKAKLSGANAIVGIKSHYQGVERNTDTEFECGSGYMLSGVELHGRLVKLAP